jgi:ABC-type thiamine transport system substrate-binding protein
MELIWLNWYYTNSSATKWVRHDSTTLTSTKASWNEAYTALTKLCNGEKSRSMTCNIYQVTQVYKLTK